MADVQSNQPHGNTLSDRLIKIEVLLEQVLSELKKGDVKFEKIEIRFEKTDARISEIETRLLEKISPIEKQQSYWQGGLALLAILWTAILAYFK